MKTGVFVKIHHPAWEGYVGEVKGPCPSSGHVIDHVWYNHPDWEVWISNAGYLVWLWEYEMETI